MAHKFTEDKTRLVISRHWHNPPVTAAVRYSEEGARLALEMPTSDFVRAIVHELAGQRWCFKQATFEDRVLTAAAAVIEKLKATHGSEVITL
jgi:hypothetical protein